MKLPPHIVELIAQTLKNLRDPQPFHVDWEAKKFGGIALMGTIGSVWLLTPDGAFLDVDSDSGKTPSFLDPEWHVPAIVAGSERYPWLAELIPARPANGLDCPACAGKGQIFPSNAQVSDSGLLCPNCSALGWIIQN